MIKTMPDSRLHFIKIKPLLKINQKLAYKETLFLIHPKYAILDNLTSLINMLLTWTGSCTNMLTSNELTYKIYEAIQSSLNSHGRKSI